MTISRRDFLRMGALCAIGAAGYAKLFPRLENYVSNVMGNGIRIGTARLLPGPGRRALFQSVFPGAGQSFQFLLNDREVSRGVTMDGGYAPPVLGADLSARPLVVDFTRNSFGLLPGFNTFTVRHGSFPSGLSEVRAELAVEGLLIYEESLPSANREKMGPYILKYRCFNWGGAAYMLLIKYTNGQEKRLPIVHTGQPDRIQEIHLANDADIASITITDPVDPLRSQSLYLTVMTRSGESRVLPSNSWVRAHPMIALSSRGWGEGV